MNLDLVGEGTLRDLADVILVWSVLLMNSTVKISGNQKLHLLISIYTLFGCID